MPRMRLPNFIESPWKIIRTSIQIFGEIDGEQRAASFAYYAIFSLIPLLALLLSVGSMFFDPIAVKHAVHDYIPANAPGQETLWQMVDALQRARGGVSFISLVILAWSSLKFFQALVRAVNAALHTEDIPWWQMPLKNLVMVGILTSGFTLGILIPAIMQGVSKALTAFEHFVLAHLPNLQLAPVYAVLELGRYLVGGLVLLYTVTMLYAFAPRRRILFRHVWLPALLVTAGLQLSQIAMVNYFSHFVNYNAVYGPIGGLMLFLFWVYLGGLIIIFGASLCAALVRLHPERKFL
jgi:YihY family inner membrane protein